MNVEHFLTKAQVEEALHLHRNTVTRLLAEGHFPRAFRMGKRWRIPAGDVERFAARGRAAQDAGDQQ